MNNNLIGSDLARAMLRRGDKQIWCAVSNDSDEQALTAIHKDDYSGIYPIVTYKDDRFICSKGESWMHAVPVRRVELSQNEIGF
ncbi:hypothetical protein AAIR29_12775 [Psychrobacter sp. FBL11]|uniref:Uncharacterized protein n=1 Tax=Psychrobacter saeujeotis TaxID=3143436 RepID=A0ABU9XAQ5_9GAMM|nr:hypothetical protein [uncultured Psychrobacter sp.]